jgi:hypothetical protein
MNVKLVRVRCGGLGIMRSVASTWLSVFVRSCKCARDYPWSRGSSIQHYLCYAMLCHAQNEGCSPYEASV